LGQATAIVNRSLLLVPPDRENHQRLVPITRAELIQHRGFSKIEADSMRFFGNFMPSAHENGTKQLLRRQLLAPDRNPDPAKSPPNAEN
jgi:hypothetical protein